MFTRARNFFGAEVLTCGRARINRNLPTCSSHRVQGRLHYSRCERRTPPARAVSSRPPLLTTFVS